MVLISKKYQFYLPQNYIYRQYRHDQVLYRCSHFYFRTNRSNVDCLRFPKCRVHGGTGNTGRTYTFTMYWYRSPTLRPIHFLRHVHFRWVSNLIKLSYWSLPANWPNHVLWTFPLMQVGQCISGRNQPSSILAVHFSRNRRFRQRKTACPRSSTE